MNAFIIDNFITILIFVWNILKFTPLNLLNNDKILTLFNGRNAFIQGVKVRFRCRNIEGLSQDSLFFTSKVIVHVLVDMTTSLLLFASEKIGGLFGSRVLFAWLPNIKFWMEAVDESLHKTINVEERAKTSQATSIYTYFFTIHARTLALTNDFYWILK